MYRENVDQETRGRGVCRVCNRPSVKVDGEYIGICIQHYHRLKTVEGIVMSIRYFLKRANDYMGDDELASANDMIRYAYRLHELLTEKEQKETRIYDEIYDMSRDWQSLAKIGD